MFVLAGVSVGLYGRVHVMCWIRSGSSSLQESCHSSHFLDRAEHTIAWMKQSSMKVYLRLAFSVTIFICIKYVQNLSVTIFGGTHSTIPYAASTSHPQNLHFYLYRFFHLRHVE